MATSLDSKEPTRRREPLTIALADYDSDLLLTAMDRMADSSKEIAKAIVSTLETPAELDSNYENANIVDAIFMVARALHHIAKAIEKTPTDAEHDALHDGQAQRQDGWLRPITAIELMESHR